MDYGFIMNIVQLAQKNTSCHFFLTCIKYLLREKKSPTVQHQSTVIFVMQSQNQFK